MKNNFPISNFHFPLKLVTNFVLKFPISKLKTHWRLETGDWRHEHGFTMIELLVVISIIGVLATLVMVSFTSSQKQAKDTQRKSDLRQYSTALEGFANKSGGLYPARNNPVGVLAATDLCGDLAISTCPEDPKHKTDASYSPYRYQSNGSASDGSATATDYVLWAKLENTDAFWVICSSGKIGNMPTTGVVISGGDCPI